ncbi:anti-sigma regulatory factor [Sphaerisporangium melleum]|uniref:Anti-sigma regulatory factor n=1 Tax=Sphaerisporangium melleum TaxID=321316 RepID=A0A917VQE7_9ACTN|nr:sensor histidine kinase [Sphaerisporangium melleum]GGL04049.1 anti-sigma regulatory factor [Sphaerisporangium melleum]GII73986.1 anti-sigma regulatory factor [Sphaerisporangium melleum]
MTSTSASETPAGAQAPAPAGDRFEHTGLFYRDEEQYATGCSAFLGRALACGDPALVAVPEGNGELIRARLGAEGDLVAFADMTRAGRNPGRILPSVLLAFADAHAGRRVWVIGEPIRPDRGAVEYPACARHEALINAAFAGRDAAILCPYDAPALDAEALADVERTHPLLEESGRARASATYGDPIETAASFDRPLPVPPATAERYPFLGVGALPGVRDFAIARAQAGGLDEERVAELLIAVNELATNTAEYTTGPGTLTVWAEDGMLVYQIDDTGHIADPLTGHVPPPAGASRGRGLLIVNELADLVRVHRGPAGTSIRLHFQLPAPTA